MPQNSPFPLERGTTICQVESSGILPFRKAVCMISTTRYQLSVFGAYSQVAASSHNWRCSSLIPYASPDRWLRSRCTSHSIFSTYGMEIFMVKGSVFTEERGGLPVEFHPLYFHLLYRDVGGVRGAVGSCLILSPHLAPRLLYKGRSYYRRLSTDVPASANNFRRYSARSNRTRSSRAKMHCCYLSGSLLMETLVLMTLQVSSDIQELWGNFCAGRLVTTLGSVANRM